MPQYYIEGCHEAIIDPETFDYVQALLATRYSSYRSSTSIFSCKIKCACCDGWYGPKVWHSTDKYRRVIWQCNHKFDGQKCTSPHLTEEEIQGIFLKSANRIIDKEEIISACTSSRKVSNVIRPSKNSISRDFVPKKNLAASSESGMPMQAD